MVGAGHARAEWWVGGAGLISWGERGDGSVMDVDARWRRPRMDRAFI